MDLDYEESLSSSSSSSHTNPTYSQILMPVDRIGPKRKAGRKKFRETRHPIYRGVRQRNGNKWVCEVREPRKKSRIWLGTFPTPEMAALAYDVAALALRGRSASLNFPDSAWRLPRPKSAATEDIQVAALEATKAFNPAAPSSSAADSKKKVLETSSSMDCGQRKVLEGSSVDAKRSDKVRDGPSPMTVFMDEETEFNMPSLINSMAEGLLLTPPAMCKGFSWDDATDLHTDLSLWNDD